MRGRWTRTRQPMMRMMRAALAGVASVGVLLPALVVVEQAAGAGSGGGPVHMVVSDGGAMVGFDDAGNVRTVRQARGQVVPLADVPSGLFLEDPTTGERHKVAGELRRQGRQVSQSDELSGPGFAVDVTYSFSDASAFQIEGSVADLTGEDRIVDVVFELPLGITEGAWERTIVDSAAISPDTDLETQEHLPVAAVTGPDDTFSLAYAIAPEHPVRFAMHAEPDDEATAFGIRTKFGLSPDAEGALHSQAPFTFVLDLGVDARWGLRSALQRYYDRSADWFASTTDRYGAWQVLPQGYYEETDYLAFHEAGRGKDDADTLDEYAANEQWGLNADGGTHTLPYTIVGQNEVTDLDELPEGCAPGRPCANETVALQAVDDWDHEPVLFGAPNSPNSYVEAAEHKEVLLNSGVFTADEKFLAQPRTTQWGGHSLTFPSNPNPNLYADSDEPTIAKYMLDYYVPLMLSNEHVDGVYVDSLWGWGRYFNYRRDHYGAATIPLTYRDQSHVLFGQQHVPGLYNNFSVLEYLWELRQRLHDDDKLLMANGIRTFQDETRAFDAFAVDAFGAEVRFGDLLEAEEDFAFYRSVGYRKPALGLIYHGLQDNDWDNEDDVAALWKMSLLYGFFGASAAVSFDDFANAGPLPEETEGMTQTEIEYQRRYAPVHEELMTAGWNPQTGVWSDSEDVRVERYGAGDDFNLVVYNLGDAQTVTMDVDARVVDWPRDGRVEEILPDNELSDQEAHSFTEHGTLDLTADEIKVLHLSGDLPPRIPQPGNASISGTVTAESEGTPIGGATVTVTDSAGTEVGVASTAGDGGYEVSQLDEGTYPVTAEAEGYESVTAEVTVAEGEAARHHFALPAADDRDVLDRENVVFLYERVSNYSDTELSERLQGAKWAILSRQATEGSEDFWADESQATQRVAELGIEPFRYVQWHWQAEGSGTNFGVNLDENEDWRFCASGQSSPATADRGDDLMYFPDLNVPEARTAVEGHISGLGDAGYEGLFFDLGNRTYVGGTPSNDGDLSNMISGCHHEDVIDPDWTFGHSQWDVVRHARESGFTTFLNCCIPSDLESSGVAAADLANQDADHLLTEQTKTSVAWDDIIPINDESEQTLGRVVNFQCADGHFTNAYYAWGRAKLWHQPVVVNAGDTDPTGTCDEGRNRSGLFPELTDARLGEPVDASYSTGDCDTSGCTYYRRYTHGLVFVNTGTMGALSSGRVELGIDGCRYMAEVTPEGPRPIGMVDGEERCHPATTRNLNPQRAIILLYRESPWLS